VVCRVRAAHEADGGAQYEHRGALIARDRDCRTEGLVRLRPVDARREEELTRDTQELCLVEPLAGPLGDGEGLCGRAATMADPTRCERSVGLLPEELWEDLVRPRPTCRLDPARDGRQAVARSPDRAVAQPPIVVHHASISPKPISAASSIAARANCPAPSASPRDCSTAARNFRASAIENG
jgi:hypothetical protein